MRAAARVAVVGVAVAALCGRASGVAVRGGAAALALSADSGLLGTDAAFWSARLNRLSSEDNQTVYNAWEQKEVMANSNYDGGITILGDVKDWGGDQAKAYPKVVTRTPSGISVSLTREECYIVFRESNDAMDWVRNFQVTTSDILAIKGGRVIGKGMSGFVSTVNKMKAYLNKTIVEQCVSKNATMYNIVGYSRGGGLASVFLLMLLKDNIVNSTKLTMTTFGSPRALTKDSAKYVNDFTFPKWRLVNRNDPVPSLPPTALGFDHVGTMLCNQCAETTNGPPDLGVLGIAAAPVNILTDHLNYCEFFLSRPYGTYGCNTPDGVTCNLGACLRCANGSRFVSSLKFIGWKCGL